MTNILIVEDGRLNLALTCNVMEKAGHTVTTASNGEEVVEVTLKSLPDMIIMMPGMGGISALSRLRKAESTSHIPVIALTALVMPNDSERLLESGFDTYLSKPIQVKTFTRQVQVLLEQQTP